MSIAIWWLRRDLRLSDNHALNAALRHADLVIPLFIFDERLLRSPRSAPGRLAFLYRNLQNLDASLRQRGSALLLRAGDPLKILTEVYSKTGARMIYAQEDTSPFARRRDETVAAELPLTLTSGLTLHHPARLVKGDGSPYVVYTPFKKAWRALPWLGDPLPAPQRIPSPVLEGGLPAAELASHPSLELFPPGEIEALRRLEAFTAGISAPIFSYATQRSRLDLNATSALSPYFHLGLLSPRQAVAAGRGAASRACDHASLQGAETWLDELIWREFYHSLLYHFPRLNRSPFRDSLARIRWRNDPEEFAAWQAGQTGYPIIDAAMRQLEQTGWMHNRARMIVASFLVKDLLVDWRWGEAHFMSRLVDGDLAANSGGWQWTAGVGADAAPYFRIFNPFLQGIKFDPQGVFIRTYLPELASVPAEFIHHPWEMPHDVQRRAGCIVGANYPAPIVDHRQARQRALFAYHTSSIRETHV